MLCYAGERSAMVAGNLVRLSVDVCWSVNVAPTGDATATFAADNRRRRALLLQQTHCSSQVAGGVP